MLSAKAGSKIVIAINAATVGVGFICFFSFGRQYLATYSAFSAAGIVCGYLITRFIVTRLRYTYQIKLAVRRNIYFSRGIFICIASLWGVSFSLTHNDFNGLSIIAALVLGTEIGEFRKMQRSDNALR